MIITFHSIWISRFYKIKILQNDHDDHDDNGMMKR